MLQTLALFDNTSSNSTGVTVTTIMEILEHVLFIKLKLIKKLTEKFHQNYTQ